MKIITKKIIDKKKKGSENNSKNVTYHETKTMQTNTETYQSLFLTDLTNYFLCYKI